MAKFTTRIELHGAPEKDVYQSLQKAMASANFSSTIILSGITYLLPSFEYLWEGTETTNAVEALAVEATLPVWKDFTVMVTRTETRIGFHNLRPAEN